MAIKVAFIGAGSVGFTRRLMRDILAVPELRETHFAMTDISKANLDRVVKLCQKDVANNNLPAKITATLDRRRAVAEADYVVNCTRIGGLEAYQLDIDIPLKYGVDQCVGDTLCVGGIMYGQRNIPCVLEFCKDIREVAKDDVLFLNYANPNAMNTWAALEYGRVNTVGLCHGVQGGHRMIAEVLGAKSTDEVDIICAGINHQTWYIRILYKGRLIGRDEDREGPHRRASAVRLFLHRVQRPPLGVPAVVPQAPQGNPPMDRPELLDQRGNRRVPAHLHGRAELVQDGFSPLAQGPGQADQPGRPQPRARQLYHRSPGDRANLSRPFQRAEQRLHLQPACGLHR